MASDPNRLSLDRYIAELESAYKMGMLQLSRDQFEQVTKPTYLDVTKPGAISGLTGMLTDRPDLYGSLANKSTIDTLMGLVNGRGQYLDDPRVPPELRGKNTLARDELVLRSDVQKWTQSVDTRDYNAGQSNADRAFAEAQRARMAEESANDRTFALQIGVDPKFVVAGQILPDYLHAHPEWSRTFAAGNQGRLPGYADLVQALAKAGQVPEDYNNGQPFANQIPAAAPGILWDPSRGWVDTQQGGKFLNANEVAGVAAERWSRAVPMRTGPNGEALFSLPPGASMVGVTIGPTGQSVIPSLQAGAATGGQQQLPGQMEYQTMAGPSVGGGGMVGPAIPGYSGPGTTSNAGQATAAIGAGQPMSLEQRRLIEQGRATDLQNQQANNDARIREKQIDLQNAIAAGDQALANRTQDELTALNNAKLELARQDQEFTQAFKAGELTGSYNGYDTMAQKQLTQSGQQFGQTLDFNKGVATGSVDGRQTVEAGALMGQFNGQSTLAGQTAYGGSALVGGGLTLDAQTALGRVGGQDTLAREAEANKTALSYLGMQSELSKNPADWVRQATMMGGTPQGIRDLVDSAAGRYRMAATGDYGTGGTGGMGTLDSAAGNGANALAEVANAQGRMVAANQQAPQNLQRMGTAQRQMLGGLYETGPNAMRAVDAEELYRKSLPRYSGPRSGRVAA